MRNDTTLLQPKTEGVSTVTNGVREPQMEDAAWAFSSNGIYYAEYRQDSALWRLGATRPDWQSHLPLECDKQRDFFSDEGLWIRKYEGPTPLALMCQGMGALWPGVGRELYEFFPAARDAMDRIAAISSWDVLGLLEEDDQEVISQTRWHIPYLFLLEYAQWAYFSSLGLKPDIICGHSLGELVALCCSGIYSPEAAWYIMDTRAEHVAALEARASKSYGMLAVHADSAVVKEILTVWPGVSVANYNTPRQFILSGERDALLEIRKSLRKRHIPAVIISVSLLFHHPSMRVLRESALLRLNGLSMHPPRIPVLSNCHCVPYPEKQEDICRFIADLDENSVRFSDCLFRIQQDFGVSTFLELGPQDVLGGLIHDTLDGVTHFCAGRRGNEARSIREATAELFALGLLDPKRLRKTSSTSADGFSETVFAEEEGGNLLRDGAALLSVLSDLCNIDVTKIRLSMDLRADLGLRSSSFPVFLARMASLGTSMPSYEDLLSVATVGDLLRLFLGYMPQKKERDSLFAALRMDHLVSLTLDEKKTLSSWNKSSALPASVGISALTSTWQDQESLATLLADFTSCLRLFPVDLFLEKSLSEISKSVPALSRLLPCPEKDFFVSGTSPRALIFITKEESEREVETLFMRLTRLPGEVRPGILLLVRLLAEDSCHDASSLHTRTSSFRSFLRSSDIEIHLVDAFGLERRRYEEIGDLLVRELSQRCSRHVLWLPSRDAKRWRRDRGTDSPSLPFLPSPCTGEPSLASETICEPVRCDEDSFRAGRVLARAFFSPERDPLLEVSSRIPHFLLLEPLFACAHTLFPGLPLFGVSDLIMHAPAPRVMKGGEEEATLDLFAVNSLLLHGEEEKRIVQGSMRFPVRHPNGRKCPKDYLSVRASLAFGKGCDGYRRETVKSVTSSPEIPLAPFLGSGVISEEWSFIRTLFGGDAYRASFSLPQILVPKVAQFLEKEYFSLLIAYEAFWQAALSVLLFEDFYGISSFSENAPFCPRTGLLLRGRGNSADAERLEMYISYRDTDFVRFNGALLDSRGLPCVTLYHMEFSRPNPAATEKRGSEA
ncbi:MAG: acyltransferase domain-containing protein [Desulfovibrio sp.]|nr:acyltransferase domain-containing protein [Desulfovibrio sp.]